MLNMAIGLSRYGFANVTKLNTKNTRPVSLN